jgi:hypothetical protein
MSREISLIWEIPVYWNFPTKWIDDGGKSFTMVFTVGNPGPLDSWNTIKGNFTLVSVPLPPPFSPPSTNPIGYWKMDDGSGNLASDASGNGSDAGVNGAVWASGISGKGLSFDGVDDYVEIPSSLWNPAQGTVAFWTLIWDFSMANNFFGHTTQPPFGNRIQLYTDEGSQSLNLGLGNADERHMGITPLQPDQWHHLALTWDGTQYRVYVDGQESASGSYTRLTQLDSVADIGNLGRGTKRDGESMNGVMDEVRVYNRTLSGSEIAELAQVDHVPPVNEAPKVNAGGDQTITLLSAASLNGVVTDDGLPNPPAATTTTWSIVGGPGSVTFGDPGAPVTTARFSHPGKYALTLTADDGQFFVSDDITVTVVVYGDSNQDGQLSAEDIHLAPDWLFGHSPIPPTGSASHVAADVNNNGVIDGDDVMLMIDRLLEK